MLSLQSVAALLCSSSYARLAVLDGEVERCVSARCARIDLAPGLDEDLCCLQHPPLRCHVQSTVAGLGLCINICAAGHQHAGDFNASLLQCHVQRRNSIVRSRIHARPGLLQQQAHDFGVAHLGGNVQWGVPRRDLGVDGVALREKVPHSINVACARRKVQRAPARVLGSYAKSPAPAYSSGGLTSRAAEERCGRQQRVRHAELQHRGHQQQHLDPRSRVPGHGS
jgi:hypothetical protein